MKDEYGLVIVEIDNPIKTGSVMGKPVYNGLFIHIKDKYYAPAHILMSDLRFPEYLARVNKSKGYGVILEQFEELHKTYFDREFFKTVKVVNVTPSNRVVTGAYLKALNLLDQYKPFKDVAKLFNKPLVPEAPKDDYSVSTYSFAKSFLDEAVKTFLYNTLEEYYSPSGRKYLKCIFSRTMVKMLEVALDYLKKRDDGLIKLNEFNHPLVKELLSETVSYKHPIYAYHNILERGAFYMCGINGDMTILFNPRFSGRIIMLQKKYNPEYTAEVIDFPTYYSAYRPKRSRGIVPVFESKVPIFCYNVLDSNYYFLAQTRFDKPVIVKVPEEYIGTRNLSSTVIRYNGKEYPVAYTEYPQVIARMARIKKDKGMLTLL